MQGRRQVDPKRKPWKREKETERTTLKYLRLHCKLWKGQMQHPYTLKGKMRSAHWSFTSFKTVTIRVQHSVVGSDSLWQSETACLHYCSTTVKLMVRLMSNLWKPLYLTARRGGTERQDFIGLCWLSTLMASSDAGITFCQPSSAPLQICACFCAA